MRFGIIILAFSVVLAEEGQGPAPSGDKPIKCGWGSHPPTRLPRIAAPLARLTRATFFISPDSAFAVHYDTTGKHAPDLTDIDRNGTPDWVEAVAVALDSSRNLLLALGFDPAPDDGDGVYDVYLQEYSDYGVTMQDGVDEQGRTLSYMLMDNDFAASEGYNTHGLDAARVTAAHEYFHAVQIGYKPAYSDAFFYELSSTWFEDVAFPEVNDWVFYYGKFGDNPTQNMAHTKGYSIAIFGHYLTQWRGMDFMLHLWQRFGSQSAIAALRAELALQGGSLSVVWVNFVAGLFFNGIESEYHFYPDQILLTPPLTDPPQPLENSLSLSFQSLREATAKIQSFQMSGTSNLSLQIGTAPLSYTVRLVVDSDGLTPYNLTDAPMYLSGLNSLSRVVVVVGAESGDLELTATAVDSSYALVYALDELGPNPVLPGRSSFTGLHLTYRVGAESLETNHRLTIYNLLGQEVYRRDWVWDVGEGTHTLMEDIPAMRHWASGVYLLTLSIGRHTLKRTFTVIQ